MKKIIIVLVIMLMPTLFFAQSAFDKFDGKDGVTAIIVSKKMFQLIGNVEMDKNNKEAQQYFDLIKKLDNLKVFTTSDSKAIGDMKSSVVSYLKKYPLEELMRVNDSGKVIKIYVKTGASSSQILELLMFIEGGKDDTVLMSLTGDFELSELSVLTDKMNLPGGSQLKKASKKS
ncbi:DUF4252 domain-containing protein [Flavobacterium arcticum]|uniref:DUF4252 domain-containing protein n=1 Tax=Flavobacterium arcticum TaxID=1784713 RepID=A0A345HEU7_9FLAO|nr:DUF4252 domain-containing protein [Flavobacterium arcticum]AXG75107.1 DUF4252 domain-containing protein [Flavobacterium arcticum]KAF2511113.1 DUF4252 domain-containing protein [Flavobacterium arcticum]